MSITIGSAVMARLIWSRGGTDHAVNVLHFRVNPFFVVDQASVNSFASLIDTLVVSSGYAALMPTTDALARVTFRDRRTANAPEFVGLVARVGTNVTEALPGSNAVVVTLRTAFAGRGFRGRVYLGQWSEAANAASGVIAAATSTAAAAFITGLRDITVAGNAMTLAVAHQVANGLPLEPGQLNDVTAHLVRDTRWDTQRRRNIPGI